MKKRQMRNLAMALLLPLAVGLCGTAGTAQAKGTKLGSRGNIIYQDEGDNAEVYVADFLLLKEKLDTMPNEIFSPAYYAHVHQWEYTDINERTHIKHCEKCGKGFELMNPHQAVREEECAITCQGQEYSGRRYSCECGWQWVRETAHVLVFEQVDENCHRSRCALDEEGYCLGYEPILEEHYAYYYIPDSDGTRHKKVCIDCAYQVEETCSFTLQGGEEESEIQTDEPVWYCECGNSRRMEGDGTKDAMSEDSISGNSVSENTIITEEEARDII